MLMLVLTIKKNPTVCYWFLLFKQTIFKEKNLDAKFITNAAQAKGLDPQWQLRLEKKLR